MGSDFNSCRFDFRLDVKTGLRPTSRRRRRPGARDVTTAGGNQAPPAAVDGGHCSTLFSCKICGCLLRSRADRKTHTLSHKQNSRMYHRRSDQPDTGLADCSHSERLLVLGLTDAHASVPLLVESSAASQLLPANFDFLRSSFHPPRSAGVLLPSADLSHDIMTPGVTLSSLSFRSFDDVIESRDRDSTSGVVDTTTMCDENSGDAQRGEALDLRTKSTGGNDAQLAHSASCGNDARDRKSRGLDVTIQKLWRFKLQQQQSACTADDVTLRDLERSRSCDNGDDLDGSLGSLGGRGDEEASCRKRRPVHEQLSSETVVVGKVTGSRLPGHNEGHEGSALTLQRVVAAPGEHPQFYTSLMRLSSPKRKPQPTQKRSSRDPVTSRRPLADSARCATSSGRASQARCVERVTCRVCGRGAADMDTLRSHMLSTHGHEVQELRAAFVCVKCGRRLASKASLTHHVNTCRQHAALTSLRRHSAHLSLRHRRLQLLQGPDSCRQVVDRRSCDTIMTSFSGTGSSTDGRVTCEFPGCRREFRELKHLKVHRMQHTDERPLSCALCSYTCRQRNSLNWHMKSRHALDKSVTDDGRTVYVSSA